jgi:hypothetical protein
MPLFRIMTLGPYARDKNRRLKIRLPWFVDHESPSRLKQYPHRWKGEVTGLSFKDGEERTANEWAKIMYMEWGEFRRMIDQHPNWFEG